MTSLANTNSSTNSTYKSKLLLEREKKSNSNEHCTSNIATNPYRSFTPLATNWKSWSVFFCNRNSNNTKLDFAYAHCTLFGVWTEIVKRFTYSKLRIKRRKKKINEKTQQQLNVVHTFTLMSFRYSKVEKCTMREQS